MIESTAIPKSGILVLDGYGLVVKVEKGHLLLEDGIGPNRRTFKLSRISKLKRLVILGHTGFITLDALRWLKDRNCALVVVDDGGELLMCEAAMMVDYPTLRRAQAVVSGTDFGVELGRSLIRRKLQSQAETCSEVSPFVADLDHAESIAAVRGVEADAARVYWNSFRALDIKWDAKVPDHWRSFDRRQSQLSKNPRKATDPYNALTNYLYRLAEVEVRIACLTYGLDSGLGLLHVDENDRDNMVLDILEVIRPECDRFILALVEAGLSKSDFHESRDGHVRILGALTAILAASLPKWRELAGELVEHVAGLLQTVDIPVPASAKAAKIARSVPTVLTGSNARKAATR